MKSRQLQRHKKQLVTVSTQVSEAVVDLDVVLPNVQTPCSLWVDDLNTDDEKILLRPDAWLNDKLINAGQHLIKQKYSHISSLQEVSLGLTLSFNVAQTEFVQVLHNGSGHWVTVSTIGSSCTSTSTKVDVFDSMPPSVSASLQNQVASLLNTKRSTIILRYD